MNSKVRICDGVVIYWVVNMNVDRQPVEIGQTVEIRQPVEINSIRTRLNSGNSEFVTSTCACVFAVLLQLTVARLGPQHASGRYYIQSSIYICLMTTVRCDDS